jgi:hypothetical protein
MRSVSNYLLPPLRAHRIAAMSLIAAIGLALGACSTARPQYQNPAWAGAQPPVPVPQKQAAYEAEAGDPIKDAPLEPARRPAAMPDDPSEPFSPNYGGPRSRPPVRISDAVPEAHDPEPQRPNASRRRATSSDAYFRKAAATASAD